MGELHLLDVRPASYVQRGINEFWPKIQDSVRKAGGKTLHVFKVVGEIRIIAVIEGCAEPGVEEMILAYGGTIEFVCTPLRSYASFAKNVLGVEKPVSTAASAPHPLGKDGHLFWLHFNIEYRGLTLPELLSVWKAEAQVALSGQMVLGVYKVVGQRNVEVFLKCPSGEFLDDFCFTLPLVKELGNQVHITTKSLSILKPTRHK